ncbi:MAG: hypothetical protein WA395_14620 [Nitrososphaeraceae archaeon]
MSSNIDVGTAPIGLTLHVAFEVAELNVGLRTQRDRIPYREA